MNNFMRLLGLTTMLAICFGCAGVLRQPPTQEQAAAADYGPAPETYKAQADAYFNENLFDPFSAQIEYSAIEKGWWYFQPNLGVARLKFGWVLHAKVNAKNRMGGYVGWKAYKFCFRGEKLENIE